MTEGEQWERIQLSLRLDRDRDREIIAQYERGLAYYRQRVEDTRYELGRLDERLGGGEGEQRPDRGA